MMPGALCVMILGLMWMPVLLADNWDTPDSVSNVLIFYTTTTLTLLGDDLFHVVLQVPGNSLLSKLRTYACLYLCVIHLHYRCDCLF